MWYVMQVLSGEEHRIAGQCKKQINTSCYQDIFVPEYIRKRRYHGTWHEERKVLFPGYVFIDTEDWEPIGKELQNISGLTKLLRNADEIAPITKEEQHYLMEMMDDNYIVQISVGYLIGEKICITEGALKNYCGYISKIDRHRRTADLMVDFFGRRTKVEVGLEVIKKVTEEEFREIQEESQEDDSLSLSNVDAGVRHVEILSGAFAGMTGKVLEEYPEKQEVRVSVQIFGNEASAIFQKKELKYS